MTYYNTNNLSGDLLRKAERLTSNQDILVFNLFANQPERLFTSHDVEDILERFPRSSIVRSINTLTKNSLLLKTKKQVIGKYGKLVYTWRINKEIPEQQTLL